MKNFYKLLIILITLSMIVGCFAACGQGDGETETESESKPATNDQQQQEFVDYASQLKFNPNSGRANAKVTVHAAIDGDTTHFNVDTSIVANGILKARYLGINTPESTGVIEPWGKKASKYTKEALANAESIYIESDDANWNLDSTGGRYLVWVWYKTAEMTDYRNLNIEILQQGLAFGSNATDNVYAEYTMGALNQAKRMKLHVFDNKTKDPDFYYGGAISVTLKELKTNCEFYEGKTVRFEGVVVKAMDVTLYMEEYDPETDMYFGMQIFCGYGVPGPIMEALSVGNRVVMVGTLQYYENGGTYQVSNIKYDILDLESPNGVHKISDGHTASYNEVSANDIINGKLTIDIFKEDEEGNEIITPTTFDYGELAHYSSVTVNNLTIKSIYTTTDPSSDDKGAMTITCESEDGVTIKVRTTVLRDADKNLITEEAFPIGSVISVKGIIDSYKGDYQIKVFSMNDVTFN